MNKIDKIFFIENEPKTTGTSVEWCESRGMRSEVCAAPSGLFPKLTESSGVVILGGDMNVDEEAKYPWLAQEKQFIKDLLSTRTPIMAICLGAQLVAECLGAKVQKNSFYEKGWDEIKDSKTDQSFHFLQWHGYGFEIPPGAERRFHGQNWQNQGYVIGERILATQFHPEADLAFAKEAYEDLKLPLPAENDLLLERAKLGYFSMLDSLFLK
jgi:GMP synthase-like glutamine amidotransferase